MKITNKTKFKKYVSIIAACLVMVIAISGALGLVLSIDNHNSQTNNGKDVLTRCGVFGHKWVEEAGKRATCQEDGYTETKYCSVCNEVETPKVTLSKLNAHVPLYENGLVTCECCNKSYGSNYYYAADYIATEDTLVNDEYVTLYGTVILKGCSSGGANYYLLVAGNDYAEVVRVSFDSAEAIAPFKTGYEYEITGVVGKIGDSYTVGHVDAYAEHGYNYYLGEIDNEHALSFGFIESACRANREKYFCKLVYIVDPALTLSSATGTTANSVRFGYSNVTASASEYFVFSMRYLREFTGHVNGSVVTFDDVVVKHKDKAPVATTDVGFYMYLATWGNSNFEFFILDEVEISS